MSAVTSMTTVSPVCVKCGIIKKSGKSSCCGRGGSWFRNCGGVAKLRHTWYEGIQSCKARPQLKPATEQYLNINATQAKGFVMTNFKSSSTSAKPFTLTSAITSTTYDGPLDISMITTASEKLFNFALFYISMLLVIVT